MKIKTTRCHYEKKLDELSLEDTLNEIGYDNVIDVLPTYYGQGEVAYTVIYKEVVNEV